MKDRLIPMAMALAACVLAVAALTLAHAPSFHRELRANPAVHVDTDYVTLVSMHAVRKDVRQALAKAMTDRRPGARASRYTRRSAYALLSNFMLDDHQAAAALASLARVDFSSGRSATGFDEAARLLFGVRAHQLSIGELALLCDAALSSRHPPAPDDALKLRNKLISDLHARGAIDQATAEQERGLPFTLAPNPVPIY